MVDNNVGSRLGHHSVLTALCVSVVNVRHIAEVAHQIEIAECTKCEHLRAVDLIVAQRIVWVDGHHFLSTLQYDVAAVDSGVDRRPLSEGVRRLNIDSSNLGEGIGDVACRCCGTHELVRPEVAPDEQSYQHIIVRHSSVCSIDHRRHIFLCLPEVPPSKSW